MTIASDFYLLSTTSMEASLPFLCRLIDKAYSQKNRIYVRCNSAAEAKKLNDNLWTFRDISFLPHAIHDEEPQLNAEIQLGYTQEPNNEFDILINLTPEILPFANKFKRVLEIIPNEEQLKAAGRSKYKQYQQQGYKLATHKI